MKKVLLIITASVLLLFSLSSCAGHNDWQYDLSNEFRIYRINIKTVQISLPDSGPRGIHLGGGETTVVQFCQNDRYVGAQTIEKDNFDKYYANNNTLSLVTYYLIDTQEVILYGPYTTEEEYIIHLEELGAEEMEWISTYYEPEGAYR